MRPRLRDLFKTLWRPDREEDPEGSLVAQAANILQVGEFQVLQLAYHEWHGQEMPDALHDSVFRAYMLDGDVPAWARHFARRIIRQDEIGLIDGKDAGYHRYDHDYVTHVPDGLQKFLTICAVFIFLAVGVLVVAEASNYQATSPFPPFFDRSEIGRGS